jgi:hypothetical protein
VFEEEYDKPDYIYINEEDWECMAIYVEAIEPFVKASRLLGGENYPSAGSTIPFLDEVCVS